MGAGRGGREGGQLQVKSHHPHLKWTTVCYGNPVFHQAPFVLVVVLRTELVINKRPLPRLKAPFFLTPPPPPPAPRWTGCCDEPNSPATRSHSGPSGELGNPLTGLDFEPQTINVYEAYPSGLPVGGTAARVIQHSYLEPVPLLLTGAGKCILRKSQSGGIPALPVSTPPPRYLSEDRRHRATALEIKVAPRSKDIEDRHHANFRNRPHAKFQTMFAFSLKGFRF